MPTIRLSDRPTCGNADCPEPYCLSSCPECAATRPPHARDCPIGGRREENR